MPPKQHARKDIDKQLTEFGWVVQNRRDMNIKAGLGLAVREVGLTIGDADYRLFADGKAEGVLEAKSRCGGIHWNAKADQRVSTPLFANCVEPFANGLSLLKTSYYTVTNRFPQRSIPPNSHY